jgi:hypothetical protein
MGISIEYLFCIRGRITISKAISEVVNKERARKEV